MRLRKARWREREQAAIARKCTRRPTRKCFWARKVGSGRVRVCERHLCFFANEPTSACVSDEAALPRPEGSGAGGGCPAARLPSRGVQLRPSLGGGEPASTVCCLFAAPRSPPPAAWRPPRRRRGPKPAPATRPAKFPPSTCWTNGG